MELVELSRNIHRFFENSLFLKSIKRYNSLQGMIFTYTRYRCITSAYWVYRVRYFNLILTPGFFLSTSLAREIKFEYLKRRKMVSNQGRVGTETFLITSAYCQPPCRFLSRERDCMNKIRHFEVQFFLNNRYLLQLNREFCK